MTRDSLRLILCAVFFCAFPCAAAEDWIIVPGLRAGPVTRTTSEKDLIRILGAKNVKRADIDAAEGSTEPGTIVFPDDPKKTAYLIWRDSDKRDAPQWLSIRNEGTLWKTDKGVTIGTSLKSLEELNGKPFTLTGFGWDYGGTIIGYHGGRLAQLELPGQTRSLIVRLAPDSRLQQGADYDKVQGDKEFSSAHAAMKKLNPRVNELIYQFPEN